MGALAGALGHLPLWVIGHRCAGENFFLVASSYFLIT